MRFDGDRLRIRRRASIPEWARANVAFGREPKYATPVKSRFDPDLLLFWREPAECVTDPAVREIVALKCSQSGGSECLILNSIRYHVAVDPIPQMYVGAQQEWTERFFKERIALGLRVSAECSAKLDAADVAGTTITFRDSHLTAVHCQSKSSAKGFSFGIVYGDEVSMWPEYAADMLRKRVDTYPFPHVVLISSPDPQARRSSDEDPIFVEYNAGSRAEWMMPDADGGLWKFELAGLKWDQRAQRDDGTWDYNLVRESAHYVTPAGMVLRNNDKPRAVAGGRWVHGDMQAHAAGRRSYRVTAFLLPWRSGDFGQIACAFLEAKRRGGEAMRTFVYEYLAEPFADEVQSTPVEAVQRREAAYDRGAKPSEVYAPYIGKPSSVIIGADVQRAHVWYVAREFVGDGDSGLIDFGAAPTFGELAEMADKLGAARVMVDSNYRKLETYEACASHNFVPVVGHDRLALPYIVRVVDPWEGTSRASGDESLQLLTLDVRVFKDLLHSLVMGDNERAWHTFRGLPVDYVRQMVSEQRMDGRWVLRRGHSANHLWDCEVYALAGAVWSRAFVASFLAPPEDQPAP